MSIYEYSASIQKQIQELSSLRSQSESWNNGLKDGLQLKVENELIKLIESLQKKLTAGDW